MNTSRVPLGASLAASLRSRRGLVAVGVLGIALFLFYISFFQDDREAYLFPGIVAGAVLLLCAVSLVREVFGLSADDFQPFPFRREVFALAVMAAAAAAAETVGMYVTCFVALFAVSAWYSPRRGRARIVNSFLFSAGFIGFMHVLFSVMLNVQLPKGLLI